MVKDTNGSFRYLILPTLFKTPEVGFALGLSTSLSFKTSHKNDSLTRTSIIQGIGFATTHEQNVQVVDAGIYFPKEKYILLGQLSHSYFPDKFWGIGETTKDKNMEHYVYEQVYLSEHLKRKLVKNLWVGVLYEFQSVYHINYIAGGNFDTSNFEGKKNYLVSGAGISITHDTRNSSFWPTKGIYLLSQFTNFRKELLSDYDVLKWITDFRYFKPLLQSKHIFAMQIMNYDTYGNTPLRELASLGGPNNLRGFYQGRYRANSMFSFIGECRFALPGRFSTCVFGGLGSVYNHYKEIALNNFKYSVGAGLRYSILAKEKLNIRLDYGYSSRYNKGLYITFGECF